MTLRPYLAEAVVRLVRFLDERKTAYALMGGLAVRIHGLPRTTYDVDALVAVAEEEVGAFARAADDAGFVVGEEFRRGFVDRLAGLGKLQMDVVVEERTVPVDVFVLASDFQRAAFARRVRIDTDLGPMWLISPEDLLLHKLLADRVKDRADVDDLLLVSGRMDGPYLNEWATKLGVSDRLREAMRRAGREAEIE